MKARIFMVTAVMIRSMLLAAMITSMGEMVTMCLLEAMVVTPYTVVMEMILL